MLRLRMNKIHIEKTRSILTSSLDSLARHESKLLSWKPEILYLPPVLISLWIQRKPLRSLDSSFSSVTPFSQILRAPSLSFIYESVQELRLHAHESVWTHHLMVYPRPGLMMFCFSRCQLQACNVFRSTALLHAATHHKPSPEDLFMNLLWKMRR